MNNWMLKYGLQRLAARRLNALQSRGIGLSIPKIGYGKGSLQRAQTLLDGILSESRWELNASLLSGAKAPQKRLRKGAADYDDFINEVVLMTALKEEIWEMLHDYKALTYYKHNSKDVELWRSIDSKLRTASSSADLESIKNNIESAYSSGLTPLYVTKDEVRGWFD